MKRWAIYARYSDEDKQSPLSIDDQVRECRSAVDRFGGTVVKIYADAGRSGFHTAQRPEYQQLFMDIRTGIFDCVIAEDTDRLARSLKEMAGLHDIAEFAGVEVWTLVDGRIGMMHAAWKGMAGQDFLRNLAIKTRRGLVGVVKRGGIPGGRCYGYDVADKAKRTINETEAAIVRRIYTEYAAGRGPRSICKDLNREGVPGPRGGLWRVSALIGNRKRLNGTLNNPIYRGQLAFNRQSFRKDPATGKRIAKGNAKEDWLIEDHPELAIVPPELWQAVDERRRELSARATIGERKRPKTLLSGLIKCRQCGSPMVKTGDYMRCSRQMNAGACLNGRGTPLETLERITIEAVQATLRDPDLLAHFAKVFQREVDRRLSATSMERQDRGKRLEELQRKIGNLTRSLETGLDSPSVRERLRALEAEKVTLEASLPAAGPNVVRMVPETRAIFEEARKNLRASIRGDGVTALKMREAFRSTIAVIRAGPQEDGRMSIEVDGNIRGILRLTGRPESDVDTSGCGNRI